MNKSLVLATLVAAVALAACGKKEEAAAPAAGVNNRVVGVALDAAVAAGDQIRVLLSPGSVQG